VLEIAPLSITYDVIVCQSSTIDTYPWNSIEQCPLCGKEALASWNLKIFNRINSQDWNDVAEAMDGLPSGSRLPIL
jgi:hypothetical protein